jgi:hypothetical protein
MIERWLIDGEFTPPSKPLKKKEQAGEDPPEVFRT